MTTLGVRCIFSSVLLRVSSYTYRMTVIGDEAALLSLILMPPPGATWLP